MLCTTEVMGFNCSREDSGSMRKTSKWWVMDLVCLPRDCAFSNTRELLEKIRQTSGVTSVNLVLLNAREELEASWFIFSHMILTLWFVLLTEMKIFLTFFFLSFILNIGNLIISKKYKRSSLIQFFISWFINKFKTDWLFATESQSVFQTRFMIFFPWFQVMETNQRSHTLILVVLSLN